VSPSTVSDLNKKIYVTIEVRRNRPIEGEHPYVYLDGLGRTSYQRATSATLASGLKLAHLFLFPCNALTTRGDEWATQQQRAVTTDRKSKILGPAVEPVEAAPPQEGLHEACSPHFAVVIEYKDQEQMTELCLRQDIFTKLAVEAEFRDMRIGELWPAPGSEDTELGVLMEPEVGHGETEVYARVQARGYSPNQGTGRVICPGVAGPGCANVAIA